MCFGYLSTMSTHNDCFDREIRKLIFNYAILSGGLYFIVMPTKHGRHIGIMTSSSMVVSSSGLSHF